MWFGYVNVEGEKTKKYIWSVGFLSNLNQKIKDILDLNLPKLDFIPLLSSVDKPPYLVFFEAVSSSDWQLEGNSESVDNDNIDIFQFNY